MAYEREINEVTTKEDREQFVRMIEVIENLNDQKREISDHIKDNFALAKSKGFDVKAMKTIIKMRKMEKDKLEQEQYMVDLYKDVVGL